MVGRLLNRVAAAVRHEGEHARVSQEIILRRPARQVHAAAALQRLADLVLDLAGDLPDGSDAIERLDRITNAIHLVRLERAEGAERDEDEAVICAIHKVGDAVARERQRRPGGEAARVVVSVSHDSIARTTNPLCSPRPGYYGLRTCQRSARTGQSRDEGQSP